MIATINDEIRWLRLKVDRLCVENKKLKDKNRRLEGGIYCTTELKQLRADKLELLEALGKLIDCATASSCQECDNCEPGNGPITKAQAAFAKHNRQDE